MNQFTDKQITYCAKLCEHMNALRPLDEGVQYAISADYKNKLMTCVTKFSYLSFSGLFGHIALLCWLDFLVKRENYERAQELVNYIHDLNKRKTKNLLKLSLNEEIPVI